jgi:hypothetical protein
MIVQGEIIAGGGNHCINITNKLLINIKTSYENAMNASLITIIISIFIYELNIIKIYFVPIFIQC